MNKKILIGNSLVAVAILILVSFTGVVGYQTTKSSTIAKASPLFTVRSSRAIDKDSKDLSCDYVGKGKGITLSIPRQNERITLIQRLIEVFRRMDEETFYRFKEFVIDDLFNSDDVKDLEISNELIERAIMDKPIPTISCELTTNTPILCTFIGGLYAIFLGIFVILLKITGFTSDPSECYTEYLPCI